MVIKLIVSCARHIIHLFEKTHVSILISLFANFYIYISFDV